MALSRLFSLCMLAFLTLILAMRVWASDTPGPGLLWLRSPLPAVFPLQVKTTPGNDYHLTLINSDTQIRTLAAYVEGGTFFRVLVPPGSYTLQIAYGTDWQGESDLFGPATRFVGLDRPLVFETKGIATKAGHIVDLRDLEATHGMVRTAPFQICQAFRVVPDETPLPPLLLPPYAERDGDPFAEPRNLSHYDIYTRVCD